MGYNYGPTVKNVILSLKTCVSQLQTLFVVVFIGFAGCSFYFVFLAALM